MRWVDGRAMEVAACLLVLAAATSAFPAGDREERPNIIFLLTDDQRSDTLGCMGNEIIQTPHIDSLAERGVVFDNAFVTTSICMTNRASIFLGQYAARHGIIDFRTPLSDRQLADSYLGRLDAAGYRTGFIGKWGVGPPPDAWDYNEAFGGQGRYMQEVDGEARHLTSIMGDQAEEFLDGCERGEPFVLSVSFKAPHVQDTYDVTEETFIHDPDLSHVYDGVTIPLPRLAAAEHFDRLPEVLQNSENRARWAVRFWGPERAQRSMRGYYRLISGVDVVVGRIVEKLRERGLEENTVILFTSDHGFYMGEYGFAGKWYAHDVSIRVPLVVYDPRLSEGRRGRRREQMALTIDLAPTMLDYAGLEPSEGTQGVSLRPLIEGQTPGDWREAFFYEHHFEHPRIPRSEAVRTARWKYARYLDSDPLYEELYDLALDPEEAENLAGDAEYAETLERMRGAWGRWRERVR